MGKDVKSAAEEKFFPVNSLVTFSTRAIEFAKEFAKKHRDGGPYMVVKNEGFPPGHNRRQEKPQTITIAVSNGLVSLPGSMFIAY
jgi:hypothetical protein